MFLEFTLLLFFIPVFLLNTNTSKFLKKVEENCHIYALTDGISVSSVVNSHIYFKSLYEDNSITFDFEMKEMRLDGVNAVMNGVYRDEKDFSDKNITSVYDVGLISADGCTKQVRIIPRHRWLDQPIFPRAKVYLFSPSIPEDFSPENNNIYDHIRDPIALKHVKSLDFTSPEKWASLFANSFDPIFFDNFALFTDAYYGDKNNVSLQCYQCYAHINTHRTAGEEGKKDPLHVKSATRLNDVQYDIVTTVENNNVGLFGVTILSNFYSEEGDPKFIYTLNDKISPEPRHGSEAYREWSQGVMVLIKGVPIETIDNYITYPESPVISDLQYPSLPEGLTFNNDFTITGTPTQIQDYKAYTFSCKLSGKRFKDNIFNYHFIIKVIDPPYELKDRKYYITQPINIETNWILNNVKCDLSGIPEGISHSLTCNNGVITGSVDTESDFTLIVELKKKVYYKWEIALNIIIPKCVDGIGEVFIGDTKYEDCNGDDQHLEKYECSDKYNPHWEIIEQCRLKFPEIIKYSDEVQIFNAYIDDIIISPKIKINIGNPTYSLIDAPEELNINDKTGDVTGKFMRTLEETIITIKVKDEREISVTFKIQIINPNCDGNDGYQSTEYGQTSCNNCLSDEYGEKCSKCSYNEITNKLFWELMSTCNKSSFTYDTLHFYVGFDGSFEVLTYTSDMEIDGYSIDGNNFGLTISESGTLHGIPTSVTSSEQKEKINIIGTNSKKTRITKSFDILITQPKCGEKVITHYISESQVFLTDRNSGSSWIISCSDFNDDYVGQSTFECSMEIEPRWNDPQLICELKNPGTLQYNSEDIAEQYINRLELSIPGPNPLPDQLTKKYLFQVVNTENIINGVNLNEFTGKLNGTINVNPSDIEDSEHKIMTYLYVIKVCNIGVNDDFKCSNGVTIEIKVINIYCEDINNELKNMIIGTDEYTYQCPDDRHGNIKARCPAVLNPKWIVSEYSCAPKSFKYELNELIFEYNIETNFKPSYDKISYDNIENKYKFSSENFPNDVLNLNSYDGTISGKSIKIGRYDNIKIKICLNINGCSEITITLIIKKMKCYISNKSFPGYNFDIDLPELNNNEDFSYQCSDLLTDYNGEIKIKCINSEDTLDYNHDVKFDCILKSPDNIKYSDEDIKKIYINKLDLFINSPIYDKSKLTENYEFKLLNTENFINNIKLNSQTGELSGKIDIDKTIIEESENGIKDYKYMIQLCNIGKNNDISCSNKFDMIIKIKNLYCVDKEGDLDDKIIGTSQSNYTCPDREGYITATCPVSYDPNWVIEFFMCSPKLLYFESVLNFYLGFSDFNYTPTIVGKVTHFIADDLPRDLQINKVNGAIFGNPIFEGIVSSIYSACNDIFCTNITININIIQPKCEALSNEYVSLPEANSSEVGNFPCKLPFEGTILAKCSKAIDPLWEFDSSFCLKYCQTDDIWPKSRLETTVTNICDEDYLGVKTRKCNIDGEWEEIMTSNCIKIKGNNIIDDIYYFLVFILKSYGRKMAFHLGLNDNSINVDQLKQQFLDQFNITDHEIIDSIVMEVNTSNSGEIIINMTVGYNELNSLLDKINDVNNKTIELNGIIYTQSFNSITTNYTEIIATDKPTLKPSKPLNPALLMTIILVVVVLIIIISLVIVIMMKKPFGIPSRSVRFSTHHGSISRMRHTKSQPPI